MASPQTLDHAVRRFWRDLRSFRRRQPARLRHTLDAVTRRRVPPAREPLRPLHDLHGLPIFTLPGWVAGPAAAGQEAALCSVARAAAWGYLRAAVDDDLVDGDLMDAPAGTLLAAAFAARHQRELGTLPLPAPFWDDWERTWEGYAAALLAEQRWARGRGPLGWEEFQVVLGRSRPLHIPAIAALHLTGRLVLREAAAVVTEALLLTSQLWDDVSDLATDLGRGRRTWVTTVALRGPDGKPSWLPGLHGLAQIQARAVQALGDALPAARELESAPLIDALHRRREAWLGLVPGDSDPVRERRAPPTSLDSTP